MKTVLQWLLLISLMLVASGKSQPVRTITSSAELQALFAEPVDSLQIYLLRGTYELQPQTIIDSSCGNCEDPATPVEATVGLQISGKHVVLAGVADRSAILQTNAGYGIFFNDCQDCRLENLQITGGIRDPDPNATNAAVVVKNSTVTIQKNRIFANIGDSSRVNETVVGIMGIAGRENALINIFDNEIVQNSWDGIALYRGASAHIARNLIDGVDQVRGRQIGGGRGVGIGVTWNADAIIEDNLIRRYWKGIGLFVDANGIVRRNIVENILTWGMSLWDAGKGKPVGVFLDNVIYQTGACGMSITRQLPGQNPGMIIGNIIIQTGQNPMYDAPDYYCYQCPLALHAVPRTFDIEQNLFYDNRRGSPDLPDTDLSPEAFQQALQSRCESLKAHPWHEKSSMVKQFCP
ncbi:MAG: right-handed parallel beta-helix repeat-containing protein [Gemmatimonadetes bacterium]|nr:MAG: right-handed parallel beta-helix repeat-containing protein [Gemmatimonadota bacterium]